MINSKKEQKGITLIALVITIIVLLILAGIAISMVAVNNGVLTKATDAKKANEQGTDGDRVRLAAQAALIDGEGTINTTVTSGKGSLYAALVEEFGSDKVTSSNYANGAVTLNGKVYTVTSTGSVAVSDVPSASAKQWSLPEGDTEVNVGDLLTPTVTGLSNEKFYVIADDGTTLTLLAERCISTITNAQVNSGYSTVVFDDSSNVYDGSDIQELVNTYVTTTLTGLDLENVEVAYNTDEVTDVKGRLMWKEETEDTTFAALTNYSDILYGQSTARINYWLGSPGVSSTDYAWRVDGDRETLGGSIVGRGGDYGLRPVIKILKSNV